jgi:hypothetical protein
MEVEGLLNEFQAAGVMGLKVATLRAWRRQGKGPPYLKLGRSVRYDPVDLTYWFIAGKIQPGWNKLKDSTP